MLLPATAFAAGTTYLPTYLPTYTWLNTAQCSRGELDQVDEDRSLFRSHGTAEHCDTTTTCPSINCSQRLAGDPWLGIWLPGIAIISTQKIHAKRRMGCNMRRYCIYSIIAHIIVSSIPSRYHMTWRTVWCLFFTALIGRWLGLGFARMLFLHVLGIMLSLCSWRHLELRHCSQKHIKRWLQYHKLSPLSKINVAVRYRFKQQHLMGHRVFQS